MMLVAVLAVFVGEVVRVVVVPGELSCLALIVAATCTAASRRTGMKQRTGTGLGANTRIGPGRICHILQRVHSDEEKRAA